MKVQHIPALFDLITEYWTPIIIGELNGQFIKLAKFYGTFENHKHDLEDEAFLVLQGVLKIKMENETLILNPTDMVIIPKKTYHQPIAEEEVHVLLFEPKSTINTGNIRSAFTKLDLSHANSSSKESRI